jgi:hypothetical protein
MYGSFAGNAIDGETIMHCNICHDTGKVTPEQSEQYWQAVEKRQNKRRSQE